VDLRREWIDYLKTNKLEYTVLLRDAIHLNDKGSSLMAQMYERHFRVNLLGCGDWMNTVRSYNVLRCLEDRKYDEMVLAGNGWADIRYGARAAGPGNSLKVKVAGKRVDLVLLPDNGWAKVLIDGKSPAQFNLFHGVNPIPKNRYLPLPATAMRYHCGPNMVGETWELTFKDLTPGKFRFSLRGSVTGDDGEGSSDQLFVSKSGRITISPFDWRFTPDYKPPVNGEAPVMVMQIVPDCLDQVPCRPDDTTHAPEDVPYRYVTVADGLPPGEHELTLIPSETGSFSIQAVEVYSPPLAPSGRP
jgi:hypothetical protein